MVAAWSWWSRRRSPRRGWGATPVPAGAGALPFISTIGAARLPGDRGDPGSGSRSGSGWRTSLWAAGARPDPAARARRGTVVDVCPRSPGRGGWPTGCSRSSGGSSCCWCCSLIPLAGEQPALLQLVGAVADRDPARALSRGERAGPGEPTGPAPSGLGYRRAVPLDDGASGHCRRAATGRGARRGSRGGVPRPPRRLRRALRPAALADRQAPARRHAGRDRTGHRRVRLRTCATAATTGISTRPASSSWWPPRCST